MKRVITPVLFAAMVWASSQAFAADPPSDSMSSSSTSHSQMMKDCMAKQKAKDSSMSKSDMRKACEAEMKMSSDRSMGHQTTPNQTTPTTSDQPSPATASPTTPNTTPPK